MGHLGTVAWVIDGATDLHDDAVLPAERDVHWLVDFLAACLADAGAGGYRGSPATLLDDIAERAGRQQREHAFPCDRLPPACSVAVAVDQGETYQISRIGDTTAVVVAGDRVRTLATDFFDRREGAAVNDQRNGDSPAEVRTAMIERRRYTMTAGDVESVFSGHPDRTLRHHSMRDTWRSVDSILLCTDGFTRVVSDYALFSDWQQAIDAASTEGLAGLEKLIRDFERHSHDSGARFKRSDDVAAILLSPEVP